MHFTVLIFLVAFYVEAASMEQFSQRPSDTVIATVSIPSDKR